MGNDIWDLRVNNLKLKSKKLIKKGYLFVMLNLKADGIIISIKKGETMEMINGHNVRITDLRPCGKKNTPMCMNCGVTGLRNLKKKGCE